MPTIVPTREHVTENLLVFTYAAMANGDVGTPIHSRYADYWDRTIQATGTMGSGGSLTLQGTNKDDVSTMYALTDPSGDAIAITTQYQMKQVVECAAWVRPKVTAGDGTTAITAIVVCRRARCAV